MRAVGLLLVLTAWAAGAARAEEPSPAPLPALPAAAAERAWEFRGYVLREGRPYGRAVLSGGPAPDRPGAWSVRDEILPLRPADFAVLQTAVLDEGLRTLAGHYHRRNAGGFLRASFQAQEAAYLFEHESDYYQNRLRVAGPRSLSALAGVVTLLRLLPPEAAVYTLSDVDPDPASGDAYVAGARLEIHGEADWRVQAETRRAWIASYERGLTTLRLAFDPETRACWGIDYLGLGIQIVPEGSGPVGLAPGAAARLATPLEQAVARTAALRAQLEAPRTPLHFLGDVEHGGVRVGSVMLAAEPASLDGTPAWRAVESRSLRVGEARVDHETGGFLGRDLRVLRGEWLDVRPEGTFHVTYGRAPGGMRTLEHGEQGPGEPVVLGAAQDAVAGLLPLLLFLRSVPLEESVYVLPGWDPRVPATPKAGDGAFILNRSDLHVEVGRFQASHPPTDQLVATCARRNGERFLVVLDARTRRLARIEGRLPELRVVARGSDASHPDWTAGVSAPPATWRQAFWRFGRGYHLPQRDLLESAFHWPSMHAQALREGRYPAGTPEATVRADWIEVFVGMSKHRTPADCDDLLFQIFMTSQVSRREDGAVSLRTRPAYGGHTYHLREIDDRWWIVEID